MRDFGDVKENRRKWDANRAKEAKVREALLDWLRTNNARVSIAFRETHATDDVFQLSFLEYDLPPGQKEWVTPGFKATFDITYARKQNRYLAICGHGIAFNLDDSDNIRPTPAQPTTATQPPTVIPSEAKGQPPPTK